MWTDNDLINLIANGTSIASLLRDKKLPKKYEYHVKKDLIRLGYGNVNLHKNLKRKRKKWSKYEVDMAVKNSYGFVDTLRKLTGRKYKCGNEVRKLKSALKEFNIDISHFPSNRERCRIGTIKYRPVTVVESILVDKTKFSLGAVRDAYLSLYNDDKCSICGINEWKSKPLVLQMDHKNGNNKDARPENLRWLCPNCHSQTDTYCTGKKTKICWPNDKTLLQMYEAMSYEKMAKIINAHPAYIGKMVRRAKKRAAM